MKTKIKLLFSFFGISYFVSVGYMDPGNWATDIEAGSHYGYELIWVLLLSNIIAIILQSLTIYLGVYSKNDLAEVCRKKYGKKVKFFLWILAEIAIIACDLAELIGTALALNLLFSIPLLIGVLLTSLDVIIILMLESKGFSKLQAIIVGLVLLVTCSFVIELILVQPNLTNLIQGFAPKISDSNALFLAIAIIGATIMPHNLYLQSNLVLRDKSKLENPEKIKKFIKDLIIALNIALIVNAAIMIVAAEAFHYLGLTEVASIEDAYYLLLQPLVGSTQASALLFGIALLLSGQASTITGTLAGQIVMEGFMEKKVSPYLIRIVTRLLAIVPTILFIIIFGGSNITQLLVLSQVILSLQLPFAMIPLILAIKDKELMKGYVVSKKLYIAAIISILIIVSLNIALVYNTLFELFSKYGNNISILLASIASIGVVILIYIVIIKYEKKN